MKATDKVKVQIRVRSIREGSNRGGAFHLTDKERYVTCNSEAEALRWVEDHYGSTLKRELLTAKLDEDGKRYVIGFGFEIPRDTITPGVRFVDTVEFFEIRALTLGEEVSGGFEVAEEVAR